MCVVVLPFLKMCSAQTPKMQKSSLEINNHYYYKKQKILLLIELQVQSFQLISLNISQYYGINLHRLYTVSI
jgi:hypothetical protein